MSLQLADAEVGDISDIINTELYPIHDSGHVRLQALIEHARAELAEDGCCLLKNFLRPEALEQARAEGQALSGKTFYSVPRSTPTSPKTTPPCPRMTRAAHSWSAPAVSSPAT